MTLRLGVSALAMLAQAGGALAAFVLLPLLLPGLPEAALPLACGGVATLLAWRMELPPWWLPLEFFFAPSAMALSRAQIPGWVFLACFAGLLAVYGGVYRGRVPLFLSSDAARRQLLCWLPKKVDARAVDLGAGLGGVAWTLARQRPRLRVVGVETAPLPFLIARLRADLGPANLAVHRWDFWKMDLGEFDFIYAYLSPAPMPELEEKLRREMAAEAVFVSNSFPLPNARPAAAADTGRHRLYLYRRADLDVPGEGSEVSPEAFQDKIGGT